jgi:hypothetical protein
MMHNTERHSVHEGDDRVSTDVSVAIQLERGIPDSEARVTVTGPGAGH